ncbi:MAG TPA: C-terminal helicase domain-containing protein, partial [Pyrinomonadaceae bacterium]|nr:C-terminal helicase domain-containing protein [Pyrinomonadaceae bacterium]
PGPLRPFFARALDLQASNERLMRAMRQLIIRHRRGVAHRRVWVGREYPPRPDTTARPDQHLLHLAPGSTIPPNAELAQYLLMKVVAEASRGKHRTTLGMDLTGCYSTLWRSKEGIKATGAAMSGYSNRLLLLLQQVTGYRSSGENREDENHPKVRLVVEEVLDRWQRGEKSLIFCFRIPTAETLSRLLSRGVDLRLKRSRRLLFEARGTKLSDQLSEDKAMQQFRAALTAREGSGVSLFLDRVLLGWFQINGLPLPALTEDDCVAIAGIYARAGHQGALLQQGGRVRLDRVFLNRAAENIWAARLLIRHEIWSDQAPTSLIADTRRLLEMIADPSWVRFRYGREELTRRRWPSEVESVSTDSVARSSLSANYDIGPNYDSATKRRILDALRVAPAAGRLSIADSLVSGPNLFVPLGPETLSSLNAAAQNRTREMLRLLFSMTLSDSEWKWGERARVLDAVVRALLREDILLRLPQSVFRDDDRTWAVSILRGLHEAPGSNQREPLAARVEEFLRELAEMGPTERESHLRYSMNSKAEAVVLVTGDSKTDRDAVFNGFNTPLLPDILVCTQVGQEGIDLHRHCSHVVHYDLGWNPATLEQRTGRVDRIGSKALRERRLAAEQYKQQEAEPNDADLPGLDIALPYLAGTYDERMFDRLRSRSQTFEILTGGDPTADRENEKSWLDPDDVGRSDGIDYVPLPVVMLDELRVDLGVIHLGS